jgi:hypothetical protein
MDVNLNNDANDAPESASPVRAEGETNTTLTWREYFETEDAVRVIYLVFGFFAILLVVILLQFQTKAICCGDWDGYYHIRWSSLLWENFKHGHWLPSFDWLPLTVLNPQDYDDHHFLLHLLQIPFLWFFEPVMAAKVAATTYATLAIFSVYWMLYRYKVDYLLVWLAALLVCSNAFYYRMNMAKAPPLAIIITVIGIHLLFQRKYIWLLPLMFAFVWTYSLFLFLMFAAIIWTVIVIWNERTLEWRPFVYTLSGMVLGNVINPYFPNNITLFLEHFVTKFKVGTDFAVAVGGEWYPYSGMELLTNFPVAMCAMLIGYILFVPKNSKLPEKATFFLAFATFLLAAQFRSKRFAEYFPPMALLFGAFSWRAFFAPRVIELPEDFTREIEPYLDSDKKSSRDHTARIAKQTAAWVIGIALVGWLGLNLRGIDLGGNTYGGLLAEIRSNEDNDKYRRVMAWATGKNDGGEDNIPAGERIFNANWDDFPKLFFYDQKHSYVYGLDPNYLYSKNPELYKLLMDITNAKGGDAGPQIREKFGAGYIFADAKENEDMIAKALESGWTDIVYEDDEARILKIRDQKGDPPGDSVEDQAPPTEEELKQLEEEEKAANANRPAKDEEEDEEK